MTDAWDDDELRLRDPRLKVSGDRKGRPLVELPMKQQRGDSDAWQNVT